MIRTYNYNLLTYFKTARMLLVNQIISSKPKGHSTFRFKQISSPHIKSWKIAYRETRKNKLLNMFQDIAKQNQSIKLQQEIQLEPCITEQAGKSSYQIYKSKQKQSRIKLQDVHSLSKPKPSIQKFYSTLRVRDSRSIRRTSKDKNQNKRTLSTLRSEIHYREQARKQFIKTPRECTTQNSPRKHIIPRKYSLDNNITPLKCKFIHRNISFDNNISFNTMCRPWSPADAIENAFITQGHISIV